MAARKIVLVGWDAADWKVIRPLMAEGRMPNVQRLVENGASGQIATLHPPLSPMLWTSIATGQRPFKHGIHGFSEPTPDGCGVQPVTNLSRRSKALWNILHQNDLRSVVTGWWPSHPAEPIRGVMVSDRYHRAAGPLDSGWPLAPGAVHPADLASALAGLRVHPEALSAELVEQFVPLAREIDQDRDQRLGLLLRTLAECMSIQAAALWLIESQSWDFFAVYYDAIDHFSHGFMRYHPRRQEWISERDFELYRNVVAMAYEFHDRMLGALLEKAGKETTAILMSDHGFHPDHLRPTSIPDIPAGPAVEHREFGILTISGPGITKGEALWGASVLDVAPTVLTLYGLPVGEDMDGKVLTEAFVETPQVEFIPSWEDVAGDDGTHPPHTRLDPVAAREALEQMIALGYIERPDENREIAVLKTIRELRYNLGESYQDAGRHWEAHEIFSELSVADPDQWRFAVRLFISCQALGRTEEMRRIVGELDSRACDHVIVEFWNIQLSMVEKRYGEALEKLERITEEDLLRPGLLLQTADLYLRMGRRHEARQVYAKVLELDSENVHAHMGLCRIALRERQFEPAAQSALNALERVYYDPTAHYLLGAALGGMKQFPRAAEAFRVAISMNPNFAAAHTRLAWLCEQNLGDLEGAQMHRNMVRTIRQGGTRPTPEVEGAQENAAGAPRSSYEIDAAMPPLWESLIVVTGLPRSGTSMLMQMLAAGGIEILADGSREADEDNPRGYFENERVKDLFRDSKWLAGGRGKVVKIVAPLLGALPPDLACRVILCERDLDEVLDSQDRMLERCGLPTSTLERRDRLKGEYARTMDRVKAMLSKRPHTCVIEILRAAALGDPLGVARELDRFLEGGLNVDKMAAVVDPALDHGVSAGHASQSGGK